MVLLEKEATPEEATNPREREQRQGIRREFPASCLQPMDEGSCQDYSLLWYFHPEAKACRPFIFGGCRGNGNRFPSRRECEQHCGASAGKAAPQPSKSSQEGGKSRKTWITKWDPGSPTVTQDHQMVSWITKWDPGSPTVVLDHPMYLGSPAVTLDHPVGSWIAKWDPGSPNGIPDHQL
ncbi:papilin-like [Corapipo altera]|uniref:papilin-like n=1 Tax=Corapipo altera TaxID=415028 RepID=UPI000FD623B7|nr:papilin-like [Corapipo altera]